ncbi:putative tetratricopeptide-like helical domain superfamily [Helianthus debilis subsp. tardiflorus]
MLHTEPSFSVYADEEGLINIEKVDLKVEKGSHEFTFAKNLSEFDKLGGIIVGKKQDEDGVDDYKKMVDQDPSNPVFLKNYAHLLQSNGDLDGAEEYYFRATQADPKDGESLMQYAKLVWELHHDQDRALGYFEAAVLATPEDSNIHAAYASFMWEIDEDDNENNETSPVEESLEIDEKCCDPLVLRNHAQFLRQTKGDLAGAEEYYLRALQADPGDGEVASQCAQLAWELHHDKDKASGYFGQALAAAPTDSHILAAYAKFLWEAEDEDQHPDKL